MTSYWYPSIIGTPVDRSRYPTHGRGLSTLFVQLFRLYPKCTVLCYERVRSLLATSWCVPHYYWGAGRPEWVSGSIPTVVPCPPSGLQFRLHVGYRTTSVQSLNQYQIDLGLYDTFSLNRIYNFVLSCYSNTHNSSFKVHEIQQISVPFVTYIHSRGPCSNYLHIRYIIHSQL